MPLNLFPSPASAYSLPLFNSLLVKGPYHPSAPLHLCLSHLQTNADVGNVLFLSPNRESFATGLQEFNDEWLTTNSATGRYQSLLSKIDIFYPPTTAHWLLLFSLFKPLSSSSEQPNKAVLANMPSLIVLHEPSAYFISAEHSRVPDLFHYLQLITTAFSTASFLSPHEGASIPLVLFDSRLGDLKLPIVRPVTPSRRLFADRSQESPVRLERVEVFVEKYFSWIGTVFDEYLEQSPRTPPRHGTFDNSIERTGPFRLVLMKRLPSDNSSQLNKITVEWSEYKGERKPHSTFKGTRFTFDKD